MGWEIKEDEENDIVEETNDLAKHQTNEGLNTEFQELKEKAQIMENILEELKNDKVNNKREINKLKNNMESKHCLEALRKET